MASSKTSLDLNSTANASKMAHIAEQQQNAITVLRKALKNNNLVVVCGAGVSMNAANAPGWRDLLLSSIPYMTSKTKSLTSLVEDAEFILAAQLVQDQLKKDHKYINWLDDKLADNKLPITNPAILKSLFGLLNNGARLATTNYDHVIEQCGTATNSLPHKLVAIDQTDDSTLKQWMDHESNPHAVLHLHGHYRKPNNLVLGKIDYYNVVNNAFASNTLRALLMTKTLLFIGTGDGIQDHHFEPLLEWINNMFPSNSDQHYLLVQEKNVSESRRGIKSISFGKERENLTDFLDQIWNDLSVDEFKMNQINSSQSSSLQPIQTLLCKNYLKNQFLSKFCEDDDVPDLTIESSYINLVIVKHDEQKNKDITLKSKAESQSSNLWNDYEDVYIHQSSLSELSDLFEFSCSQRTSNNKARKLLVYGRAGIGKTTLVDYVCYRWAQKKLWNDKFDCIFRISIRDLQRCLKDHNKNDLSAILNLCCPGLKSLNDQTSKSEVRQLIHQHEQHKILLILDGYDEKFHDPSSILSDFVLRLMDDDSGYYLIMTSRPNAVESNLQKSFDIQLENIGLNPKNVNSYVKNYFGTDLSNITALTTFIHRHPTITALVRIPINLFLLCYTWSRPGNVHNHPMTLTALYEAVVNELLRRVCNKLGNPIKNFSESDIQFKMDKEIKQLESVAFYAFESKQIIIAGQYFKEHFTADDYNQMFVTGFFKAIGDTGTTSRDKDHYFIHLTFQEYFAACHVFRLLSSLDDELSCQAIQFIETYKYSRVYERVMQFIAGKLCASESIAYNRFWKCVCNGLRDLASCKQMVLVMNSLSESRPGSAPPTMVENGWTGKIVTFFMLTSLKLWNRMNTPLYHDEQIISALVDALKNKNAEVRSRAAGALGELGSTDSSVIFALVDVLKDKDAEVRRSAVWALGELGSTDSSVISELVDALKDKNAEVKSRAATALCKLGSTVSSVISTLVDALKDEDVAIRRGAVDALDQLRSTDSSVIFALVDALKDEDAEVRRSTASALGELGSADSSVITALMDSLKDKDAEVRDSAAGALCALLHVLRSRSALDTLGELGSTDSSSVIPPLLPALLDALNDDDVDVSHALEILMSFDSSVVPALLAVLYDEDVNLRRAAAGVLADLGTSESSDIPALLFALNDEDSYVREIAVRLLGRLSSTDSSVVNALLVVLKEDATVRFSAGLALRELSSIDSSVISALLNALKDEDAGFRAIAADALGQLNSTDSTVLNALLDALKDEDAEVRRSTASALYYLRSADSSVIDALVDVLKYDDAEVRRSAASALGQIRPADSSVIDALVDVLKDDDAEVRRSTARALGELGSTDFSVIDALLFALKDENAEVRSSAAWALGELESTNSSVISTLLDSLKDQDAEVRRSTASALCKLLHVLQSKDAIIRQSALVASGELGSVISALVDALRDEDAAVRRSALDALGELRSTDSSSVISILLAVLKDKDAKVRWRAATVLRQLSSAASSVISALLFALKDEDAEVREIAADVLGQLGSTDSTVIDALLKFLKDVVSSDIDLRRDQTLRGITYTMHKFKTKWLFIALFEMDSSADIELTYEYVAKAVINKYVAISITSDTLIVHDNYPEPIMIPLPRREMIVAQLQAAFTKACKQHHIPSLVHIESSSTSVIESSLSANAVPLTSRSKKRKAVPLTSRSKKRKTCH